MKFKQWIKAARLRTLPLSVSGILVGSALAYKYDSFNALLFALLVVCTILLQILSNFANDLGDFQHGIDNENRVGPQRTLQSGGLAVAEMKRGIVIVASCAFVVGMLMLFVAFGFDTNFWIFLALGIAAIVAALRYTMGKNPYGYRGLGDVMVLIFFGFSTVVGAFYIITQTLTTQAWLLGLAIGCFSMGVLNINNLRDVENDKISGKRTIIVKFGVSFGKVYHIAICVTGIAIFVYSLCNIMSIISLVFIALPIFLLVAHTLRVATCSNVKCLDPELKKLSLSTFALSVLFSIALLF